MSMSMYILASSCEGEMDIGRKASSKVSVCNTCSRLGVKVFKRPKLS